MDRVFLDANVLFSAAYGSESGLLKPWRLKGRVLVTSAYARYEARTNLAQPEQRQRLDRLIRGMEVVAEHVDHPLTPGVELPEKDRPILMAAICAKATPLLTGDVTHFGKYYGRAIAGVMLMRPSAYLKSLSPGLRKSDNRGKK